MVILFFFFFFRYTVSKDSKKQYGLIGYPLGHSFSQRFFTDKFEEEEIDAVYQNYEIADIHEVTRVIEDTHCLQGFNVTIPHKQTIMPLLSSLSDEACEIGAVNVVKVDRKGDDILLKGYNSDVVGFVDSIKPLLKEQHSKALVLGTGGASKAIVYGLKKLGVEVQLVSRKRNEEAISYEDITEEMLSRFKLLVNCTPLGTYPDIDSAPDIPYQYLGEEHLLYDLVYNPDKTEFLRRGECQGARIKNGAEMLRLQALEAWRIWEEE